MTLGRQACTTHSATYVSKAAGVPDANLALLEGQTQQLQLPLAVAFDLSCFTIRVHSKASVPANAASSQKTPSCLDVMQVHLALTWLSAGVDGYRPA